MHDTATSHGGPVDHGRAVSPAGQAGLHAAFGEHHFQRNVEVFRVYEESSRGNASRFSQNAAGADLAAT